MGGVEYENTGAVDKNHDKDAACIVCQQRSATGRIPYVQWGRKTCSGGQKTEYYGVIMAPTTRSRSPSSSAWTGSVRSTKQAATVATTAVCCTRRKWRRVVPMSLCTAKTASCRALCVRNFSRFSQFNSVVRFWTALWKPFRSQFNRFIFLDEPGYFRKVSSFVLFGFFWHGFVNTQIPH